MFKALVLAAAVSYIAYQYGVDTGRQEAERQAASLPNHPAAVRHGGNAPATRHYHDSTDSSGVTNSSKKLAVTVERTATDLIIRAKEVVPDSFKDKSARVFHEATRSLDTMLKGAPSNATESRVKGPSI